MKFRLTDVRLAFPQLFEAKQVNGEGKAAFSASFLIDPKNPKHVELLKVINANIDAVAKEKWKDKTGVIMAELRAKDRIALHDGNGKASYAGFQGMMFVSARSYVKPATLNPDRSPTTAQDGKLYAGCYVDAVIELYAQDNKYGKRINATLGGVQFRRDGDAFAGGAAASEDDFESLEETSADDLV